MSLEAGCSPRADERWTQPRGWLQPTRGYARGREMDTCSSQRGQRGATLDTERARVESEADVGPGWTEILRVCGRWTSGFRRRGRAERTHLVGLVRTLASISRSAHQLCRFRTTFLSGRRLSGQRHKAKLYCGSRHTSHGSLNSNHTALTGRFQTKGKAAHRRQTTVYCNWQIELRGAKSDYFTSSVYRLKPYSDYSFM